MAPAPETAKAELLARVLDEVARHGLADRSLRELAAALGTSHRMLLYHFGTREGLVAEVVAAVEAAQRDVLRGLSQDLGDAPAVMRALWAQVSDPALRPFVQLFFEAVAYASRSGRPGGGFTRAWLEESEAATARLGMRFDPVEVRLGVAVTRGLLVDVITGEDPAVATAALERFVALWEASRSQG